jgi:hypothetical protein
VSRLDTLRRIAGEAEVDIARLRAELVAARARLSSLRRSIGALESRSDRGPDADDHDDPVLRVRSLIREAGRPLFIDDILRGLDRPISRDAREELRALLRPWLRRGEVFTRPRPSTFGLVEQAAAQRPRTPPRRRETAAEKP